jgi:hypothetical protein
MKPTLLAFISLTALILGLNVSSIQARDINSQYDCWNNFRFVNEIPDGATKQMIIVSCRYFSPDKGYKCLSGVHPCLTDFVFLVCAKGDSAFIIPQKSISQAMNKMYNLKDFLIYVNGHKKTFEQNIGRGLELCQRYSINLIMYDWPTDYLFLRKTLLNSKKITKTFSSLLIEFHKTRMENFPNSSASIVFHSMGNNLAKNLVEMGLSDEMESRIFNNLILNAAAVNQKNHSTWVERLNIQERLYITYNKGDMALRTVRHLRLSKQLGTGFNSTMAKNAIYVSFNNVAAMEHNFFLGRNKTEKNNPRFYELYSALFSGSMVDLNDNNLLSEEVASNVYCLH